MSQNICKYFRICDANEVQTNSASSLARHKLARAQRYDGRKADRVYLSTQSRGAHRAGRELGQVGVERRAHAPVRLVGQPHERRHERAGRQIGSEEGRKRADSAHERAPRRHAAARDARGRDAAAATARADAVVGQDVRLHECEHGGAQRAEVVL